MGAMGYSPGSHQRRYIFSLAILLRRNDGGTGGVIVKTAPVGRSRQIMSQHMSHEKRVQAAPDYFGEALRILDNDITLEPQREHLAALWGLFMGLTRRLTLNARTGGSQCHQQCEKGTT